MALPIKPASKREFAEASLDEVMLHLDPGALRARSARRFQVWKGGGVDAGYIGWREDDGIGRTLRNGLNFTKCGFGIRGAIGGLAKTQEVNRKITRHDNVMVDNDEDFTASLEFTVEVVDDAVSTIDTRAFKDTIAEALKLFRNRKVAATLIFGFPEHNGPQRGMRDQMNMLSDFDLLGRFVGMITGSRPFLSYPRRKYFRHILCDPLGKDVESRRLPDRAEWMDRPVADVCHGNATRYFGFAA